MTETPAEVAMDLLCTLHHGLDTLCDQPFVAVRAGVGTDLAHRARGEVVRVAEKQPLPFGRSFCVVVKDQPDGWSTLAVWVK